MPVCSCWDNRGEAGMLPEAVGEPAETEDTVAAVVSFITVLGLALAGGGT